MPRQKLKQAPLQEVIFELSWDLPLDESGFPHDLGFEMAQGVFASKIKKDFPVQKRLLPNFSGLRIHPILVHQFWKDEITWPVIQLGPGLLTVNDTDKNYVWKDNFQLNVEKAIAALRTSYEQEPKIQRVKLQYIDAVEFIPEDHTVADFLKLNMKTELINHYRSYGRPRDIHIGQTFNLEMDSILNLNIQSGIHNKTGNPAIIWTTAIERTTGLDFINLFEWLEYSHQKASETFVKMLNPDFYDTFDN